MDDAQRAGLLVRARPPETTLAWLLEARDATDVVEVAAIPGASTSAMHRVTVRARKSGEQSVVLRRYVRARPISTYKQSSYQPPRWTARPELWERAVELFRSPIPPADVGFIHRDFNPGNILWVRRELTGIVDWQAACVGPRSIDPAHCRLNLFQYDPTMADDIRRLWEQRSGLTFDPWADLASIVGSLDHLRSRRTSNEATWAIEQALTAAVHDLS